jgi:hypothetical protein
MKSIIMLSVASMVLFGCAQTNDRQRLAGPPPGMVWQGAEERGYSNVYTTADVIARPEEGVVSLMQRTQRAMNRVSCHGPRQISIFTVVSEEGEVLGVYPPEELRGECVLEARRVLSQVRFSPAVLNDEPVKFMISFRINLQ